MVTAYEKAKADREAKDKEAAEERARLQAVHENATGARAKERATAQEEADKDHQAGLKAKAKGSKDTGGPRAGVTTAEAEPDEDLPGPVAAPGTAGASATNPKLAMNWPPEQISPYGEGAAPPDTVRRNDDGTRVQTAEEKAAAKAEAERVENEPA